MRRHAFETLQALANSYHDWAAMSAAGWYSVPCDCGDKDAGCPGWRLERRATPRETDELELQAADFRRMTGMYAPGKEIAAGMPADEDGGANRRANWALFLAGWAAGQEHDSARAASLQAELADARTRLREVLADLHVYDDRSCPECGCFNSDGSHRAWCPRSGT